jgi:hypothetical protein
MTDLLVSMNPLTFEQLVELGRSVIPTIAPGWTDHNVHDPGIMLMELTAWIAEAQIYSVSRLRRDERLAFARLLGIEPAGPQPAEGLLWPQTGVGTLADSPAQWPEATMLDHTTELTSDRPDAPKFFPRYPITLTAARLVKVETLFAEGAPRDWTAVNSRDGATFLPFGDVPDVRDRLVLSFEMMREDVEHLKGPLSIGVEIVNQGVAPPDTRVRRVPRLLASLTDADRSVPLRIRADTTGGLLKSGVVLLDIHEPPRTADGRFTVTIRATGDGLLTSPRVQRIAPNVLAAVQAESITNEFSRLKAAQPNQRYTLQRSGLMFPFGQGSAGPFTLEVFEDGAWRSWTITSDLTRSEPGDRHFELDRGNGVVSFGNGVNGYIPTTEVDLRVGYTVCEGPRGNLPKNIPWTVRGVAGVFGVNSEVMANGREAQGLRQLRALARSRSRTSRPIVTSGDLESAAMSFADLGIKRARELAPNDKVPKLRGTRILVVVGSHDSDSGDGPTTVGRAFLGEVRARLAPRLPLGQRLEVVPPRYVPLRVEATLVAARNADPRTVSANAEQVLQSRLSAVGIDGPAWPFGRDVTGPSVRGWLRRVPGVAAVRSVRLLSGDRAQASLTLSGRALPQFHFEDGDIQVERQPIGSTR